MPSIRVILFLFSLKCQLELMRTTLELAARAGALRADIQNVLERTPTSLARRRKSLHKHSHTRHNVFSRTAGCSKTGTNKSVYLLKVIEHAVTAEAYSESLILDKRAYVLSLACRRRAARIQVQSEIVKFRPKRKPTIEYSYHAFVEKVICRAE